MKHVNMWTRPVINIQPKRILIANINRGKMLSPSGKSSGGKSPGSKILSPGGETLNPDGKILSLDKSNLNQKHNWLKLFKLTATTLLLT